MLAMASVSRFIMAWQLEHAPGDVRKKWKPVLQKTTCSSKEMEQDDDSK